MTDTMRTWAEINTNALVQNYHYAKSLTGKKIMAVIKGDAHGHGAVRCGAVLEAAGADAFAVATLGEAVALREGGIRRPVLILGWTPAEEAQTLEKYDLAQSVFDEGYAEELNAAAAAIGATLRIHIKLDTGMSRTGIFAQNCAAEAAAALMRIMALPALRTEALFTHFAAADMPEKDDFTAWQLENYKAVLAELERLGADLSSLTRHIGNSACIMYHKETHFDMVRMGVMMYGLYPDGAIKEQGELQPVLTLKSRVVQVKELPAGAHISYGCTAVTEKPTKIAVVGAGYADAYPRRMSNRGAYAVINGVRCPQIGRICMDLCMFDVTGVDVHRGDEVILYGRGGMPMELVAELADSINCEPTSVLTQRVAKVYV
ncbi:MAG: alanine racemase [Oscillospiraceae bacterium]|nr:alanine racemase [Oscillospiraceae bacterium]